MPLAKVGLARAYVMAGDKARARVAYQDFLALWKDADPDVPRAAPGQGGVRESAVASFSCRLPALTAFTAAQSPEFCRRNGIRRRWRSSLPAPDRAADSKTCFSPSRLLQGLTDIVALAVNRGIDLMGHASVALIFFKSNIVGAGAGPHGLAIPGGGRFPDAEVVTAGHNGVGCASSYPKSCLRPKR